MSLTSDTWTAVARTESTDAAGAERAVDEAARLAAYRAAELEFQAQVEQYRVEGVADYWDREDLIALFLEAQVRSSLLDRPTSRRRFTPSS